MAKTHAAGMGSGEPTPAQLKELFAQIESGRITRGKLQSFLNEKETAISWERAVAIMGDKAIGIEISAKLGLRISVTQMAKYVTVQFSEAELEAARDKGLYLVAMPEVTLAELREATPDRFLDQSWYNGERFSNNKSRFGYHLLGELPDSTSKNWNEQQAMLSKGFKTPKAVEIAYLAATVLPREAFPDWLRTADVDAGGNRVDVAVRDSRVGIDLCWGSSRNSFIGVACGSSVT